MPQVAPHIYQEIAFIAYHFHWSYEDILAMEHAERKRWCQQISDINDRMNEDQSNSGIVNLENLQW